MVDLPIKELGDEAPEYDRPWSRRPSCRWSRPLGPAAAVARRCAAEAVGSPDLSSKRWITEQYDTLILGNSVITPGGDAGLVRIEDGPKGLAMTADVTPRYCEADPFEGGKQAVAEAWRNLTAVGATPLAITDNLNFGNPERPEVMGQLVGCIKGIGAACKALDFPVVSGNVSLYNETNGVSILPTPTIGGVGVLADVTKHATVAFKAAGESDHPDRRDQGLARPVGLSRDNLRPGRGRAAAGRSRDRAQEWRCRAGADHRPARQRLP
jgi:phosphoribosylformylglycinamidine (FGAM) synthase-like enzyme